MKNTKNESIHKRLTKMTIFREEKDLKKEMKDPISEL